MRLSYVRLFLRKAKAARRIFITVRRRNWKHFVIFFTLVFEFYC